MFGHEIVLKSVVPPAHYDWLREQGFEMGREYLVEWPNDKPFRTIVKFKEVAAAVAYKMRFAGEDGEDNEPWFAPAGLKRGVIFSGGVQP